MNAARARIALPLLAALLTCCVLALTACRGDAPDTPEEANAVTIELDANPSTGYEWSYALSQTGVVEVTRDEYVTVEHEESAAGYGGTQVYEFSPVADGIVAVRLDYARSSEDEPLSSELHVFKVSDGRIAEVAEGLQVDELVLSQAGTSVEDVYDYHVERSGDACTATVAYDCLDWTNTIEDVDPAFMDALGRIAAACDVESWDGFSERDDDVLDGSGFSLSITLADGSEIHASGTNAEPEGFVAFSWMVRLLFEPYDMPPA